MFGSAPEVRLLAPIAMLAILALAGCAERDLRPEERLDPNTAVNVTIMAEPWIYSRDIPMPVASASDFLNVGVVETNRAGTRAYWLGVIAWSTVDRSIFSGAPLISRPVKIRLSWSAGSLELEPARNGRQAVGLGEPVFVDPQTKSTETWYPLTTAQLAQLAKVAPTGIALIDEAGQPTAYVPWRLNAAALSEFLKATGS
jgi:hypothetical protein